MFRRDPEKLQVFTAWHAEISRPSPFLSLPGEVAALAASNTPHGSPVVFFAAFVKLALGAMRVEGDGASFAPQFFHISSGAGVGAGREELVRELLALRRR